MPDNVIVVVNQLGENDGMLDGIVFCNILKELTLDDIYGDVNSQDDSSCASDKRWDMSMNGGQADQKNIVYDDVVDDDEIDNLNKQDVLHLLNGLADNNNDDDNNNNYIEHSAVINQQDGPTNYFVCANNNPQAQNEHFGGVNKLDQNNIDKGEEHGKAGDEVQN